MRDAGHGHARLTALHLLSGMGRHAVLAGTLPWPLLRLFDWIRRAIA